MKVWLITKTERRKRAISRHGAIVCMLHHKYDPMKVEWIMKFLYLLEYGSLREQLSFLNCSQNFPLPCRYGETKTKSGKRMPWSYQIVCGHDPVFDARIVDNFKIRGDEYGPTEIPFWDEIPKPIFEDD